MRRRYILITSFIAGLAISPAAHAQLLKVVEVSAPEISCVFDVTCTFPTDVTRGNIALPFTQTASAWLETMVFPGLAPAPGAGTFGYEYRISMTQASGAGCILGFNLNFGPHKPLPYLNNALADVYVVTKGGIGTIGIKSAERFNDVIVFTLKAPLCADGDPDQGKSTFLIGIAGTTAPMHVTGTAVGLGVPSFFAVDARVPTHNVPNPPGEL